ncbi:MAG: AmmeMemoRadiSam system protein B, partial [Candidatus Omnitrophica bacterium]|nr:AmmeMemoRadiSam system protein B [Candidatus Omnitrophota bacterium]
MKRFVFIFLLIVSILHPDSRKPIFSGSFYPSDINELKQILDKFFKNVNYKEKIEKDKVIGIISPHAGYIYSGQVAAYSYKFLENSSVNTVILIGRSHRAYFKGAIIDDREEWETPLGKIEIDKEIFEKLYRNKNFFINKVLFDYEHSLEVQIPFLQYILKNFKIFPILLGDSSKENIDEIADALYDVLKNKKNWLIVASTDLSHYYPYDTARKKDLLLLEILKTKD